MSIAPTAPLAMTPVTLRPSQQRICASKLLVVEHPVTKSPVVGLIRQAIYGRMSRTDRDLSYYADVILFDRSKTRVRVIITKEIFESIDMRCRGYIPDDRAMLAAEVSGVLSPVEIIRVFVDLTDERFRRWKAVVRTFDTLPRTLEVPITELQYRRFLSIRP